MTDTNGTAQLAADAGEAPRDLRVLSEPLTYEPNAPHSYFQDLALARRENAPALRRLDRHAREMRVELALFEQRARRNLPPELELEVRANPDRTPGQGGYFAPPLWLIDEWAPVPRPKRVLAGLAPNLPLPGGVQSVNVPRMTTGDVTAPASDLGSVPSQDLIDASLSSPVITITGEADVSLQLLEQSPPGAHLDFVVFRDLAASYDAQLEAQLINGSGSGANLTGLLNVANINTVTYTSSTPTGSGLFGLLGQAIAAIGNKRYQPPETWLMTTSRWGWIATAEDTQARPFILANSDSVNPVAWLIGFPVHLADAIPINLGAGQNQDRIIACVPSDMLVLESAPRTQVMLEVLSGTLQARLQYRRYVAALVGRQPSGISAIAGTGTVVQPNF